MNTLKSLRIYAGVISVLTLVLVSLGSFVRVTGAGLACPDWPLCFGEAVPEFSYGVTQEVVHRYLASFVGAVTLLFGLRALKARRTAPGALAFAGFALGLLGVQILFGGLTVTMKLVPWVVTAHLILGTLFLQSFALVATERAKATVRVKGWFWALLLITTLLTFLQIGLGGYVGSSGASLACTDIPFCGAKVMGDMTIPGQHLHMQHRMIGIVIGLLIVGLVATAKRAGLLKRGHLFGMLTLVLLQIALGFLNVYYRIPAAITVAHIVVAQLLLMGLAILLRDLSPRFRVFPAVAQVPPGVGLAPTLKVANS